MSEVNITQDMIDTVISMYVNGDSIKEIENAIGHSDSIVYKILKEHNIPLNRKEIHFTEEQIDQIIELHKDGLSYQQIADKFKVCSEAKIYTVLSENNALNSFSPEKIALKINSYTDIAKWRKNYFDEHIFDIIDTPDKAYCIGLFMADGCNQMDDGKFSIELQERDKSILEKIKIMFQADYPLIFRDKEKTPNMSQNTYRLNVFSKYFCSRLNELGVIPNKSLTLKFPEYMPKWLIPYLIKGYIDGDGWVQEYRIAFMSTLDFCLGVKEYLSSIGIECKIMDMKRHYKDVTKTLYITGKNNIIPLSEIMFSHGNLYIERKYQKYLEYGFINNGYIDNSLSA